MIFKNINFNVIKCTKMKKLICVSVFMFLGLALQPSSSIAYEQQSGADWRSGYSPGDVLVDNGWIFTGAGGGMFIRSYTKIKCCVESNSNSACDFGSKKISSDCAKNQKVN